jgi:hypothetical protein
MDPCTVETGLLRKKPCGRTAVAKCASCERPLCSQHAVAQLTAAGRKSGTFLCQECDAARRDHEKSMAAVARSEKDRKMAAIAKAAVAPPPPAKKPAAPASAPPKEAPKEGGSAGGEAIEYKPEPKKDDERPA